MKLNVIINNPVIDSKTLPADKLVEELRRRKDLVADICIGGGSGSTVIMTSPVHIIENNGYLMGAVDARFAFPDATSDTVEIFAVNVRQASKSGDVANNIILRAESLEEYIIDDTCGYDADIYFTIANIAPDCTMSEMLPETKLNVVPRKRVDVLDESSFSEDPLSPTVVP